MNRKLLATILSVILLGSAAGVTAWAVGNNEQENAATETAAVSDETTSDTILADSGEAVYVLTTATGKANKIIVSGKFADEKDAKSVLHDAENVKGDDCWQGTVDKALPVDLSVSYQLDGKSISPAALVGKSGRVSIRFNYQNNERRTVTVDGQQETVCVPFAALTGLMLDGERFHNVSVTNGKLLDDGTHIIVAGAVLPGLQDSLQLSRSTLELPEYLEIQADVTNFALENTVTLVSSTFADVAQDASGKWDLSSLQKDMNTLIDAMMQLISGSGALYDGLCSLYTKTGELSDGVKALAAGLQELDSNSASLNDGAKQVFTSLLRTADTQLAAAGLTLPALEIDNYDAVLDGVLQQLDHEGVIAAAQAKVEQAVRANESAVQAAVTAAVQQQVAAKVTAAAQANVLSEVLASQHLSAEQYAALPDENKAAIDAAVETQLFTEPVQQQIAAQVSTYLASEEGKALIAAQTEQQVQALIVQNMGSDEVQQQIAAADAGAQKVQALKQQMDSYKVFYQGLQAYTAGVSSASAGAAEIGSYMPALTDGVAQLRDGAKQICDGLQQLNDQGIQKLANLLDQDVAGLSHRMQALVKAGQEYRSFVSDHPTQDASVKFIYRTEAVKAAE